MSPLLLGLALSMATALPALAALKPGERAPSFSARVSVAGRESAFSLADALRNGAVVVYFYPSAYTAGRNLQPHALATAMDPFAAARVAGRGLWHDRTPQLKPLSADP